MGGEFGLQIPVRAYLESEIVSAGVCVQPARALRVKSFLLAECI